MSAETGNRIFGMRLSRARWVFGLSLALNFLVVGLIVGAIVKVSMHDGNYGSFRFSSQLIEAAGPDRREAVSEIVRKGRGEGWRAEMQAELESLIDIVGRTPFDAEALRAAFAESAARRGASRLARNESTIEALALLTDEERAAFAAKMRARMEKFRKKD